MYSLHSTRNILHNPALLIYLFNLVKNLFIYLKLKDSKETILFIFNTNLGT